MVGLPSGYALETAENEIAVLRIELAESPTERLQRLETESETLKEQVETLKRQSLYFLHADNLPNVGAD